MPTDSPKSERSTGHGPSSAKRQALKDIAESTLDAIEHGSYLQHDLRPSLAISKQNTRYYAPDSLLSMWSAGDRPTNPPARITLCEVSTLEGARLLANDHAAKPSLPKIGILNFASAKKVGGGFRSGAQAQEESIARSSTLYPSLMTRVAQEFYTHHNKDPKGGYYSHAMVYSPNVVLFRDDQGGWVEPLTVDVLTSPAVNAGVVRQTLRGRVSGDAEEERITKVMKERMARILFLFETQGVKNIVLGSFGTGVFRNDVPTVADLWGQLLLEKDTRFQQSFDQVMFAVLGRQTFEQFEAVFTRYGYGS
ncbi:hypothetical protein PHLCEN_2v10790 [Hermanssonia centrifuga]|uniref:Microbial-type PARG catalytic domain-containing protein n=1 Tax=Hermanssonia centrifuga TaxID=98765 RepID=A0A2R6NLW8_9APHY|nr:hypothetical protein PHLCEN_2v10790 [Hermanssonia centrifuga]